MDSAILDTAKQTPNVCVLDAVNGMVVTESANVKNGSVINLSGWVISSDKKAPEQFVLILKGVEVYGLASTTGVSRPDVAKAVDSNAAATAGFSANTTLSNLANGTYQVLTLVQGPNGRELCNSQRQLVINN